MARTRKIPQAPAGYMTIGRLGELSGISPAGLYQRRARGASMPPARKISGRVFFRDEDVQAWLESFDEPVVADATRTAA